MRTNHVCPIRHIGVNDVSCCGSGTARRLRAQLDDCVGIRRDSVEEGNPVWTEALRRRYDQDGAPRDVLGARFGMLTDRFGIDWMVKCERTASRSFRASEGLHSRLPLQTLHL